MKNKNILNIALTLGLMTTTACATFMFGGGEEDSSVQLSTLFTPKNYSKLPGEKTEGPWRFERQTTYIDEKNSSDEKLACITFALEIKASEFTKKRKAATEQNGKEAHLDKKAAIDPTSSATSSTNPPTPFIKVDPRSCLPEVLAHDSPGALFEYFKDALSHKLLGDKFLPPEDDKELLLLIQDLGDFDARKLEERKDTTDKFQYNPETVISLKRRAAQNHLAMSKALYEGIRKTNTTFSQRFIFPQNTGEITLAIQQSTLMEKMTDDMQKLPHFPSEFFDSLEAWMKSIFDHINFQVEEKSPSSMHN